MVGYSPAGWHRLVAAYGNGLKTQLVTEKRWPHARASPGRASGLACLQEDRLPIYLGLDSSRPRGSVGMKSPEPDQRNLSGGAPRSADGSADAKGAGGG